MKCPYSDHECIGPTDDEVRWICPVHNATLTRGLTRLCRARENYFLAWNEGRGPGQRSNLGSPTKGQKTLGCGSCGDKRKSLTLMGEAWSVVTAVGSFAASGFRLVDRTEYERRLAVCDGCEFRGDERVRGNEHRCGECGCYVAVKAQATAWQCPIGKWNNESPKET